MTLFEDTGLKGPKTKTLGGIFSILQPIQGIGLVMCQRFRVPIASVNAGFTILPAIPGTILGTGPGGAGAGFAIGVATDGSNALAYRMVNMAAIAVGGAAGAVTTVNILGTQAGASVKLAAFAQANLTQSTYLAPGVTGCAVLADGASFAPCDVNTAITVGITGSNITTATNIDFIVSYSVV